MSNGKYSLSVPEKSDTYKLSVTEGKELQLTLNSGSQGPVGPTGPANILSIGTVTTGVTPAATITGTSPAQTLSLTLPQGPIGPTGLTGSAGPANTLSIGTVGVGTAAATITGTSPAQTLNLTLPQGPTGPTNTLSIGTVGVGTAAATITGTSPAQTLNLTLPQGPTGPANTLSIGTVESGVTPAATITGTAPAQTLNLTLPTGPTGSVGPANTLSIGTVGVGTAAATITGTAPAQTLNLTIPTGPTGSAGPANTLSIGTVTTGVTPAATITGTSPSQTLNLTLPQGPAGPVNTLSIGTVQTGTAAATITGTAPAQTLNLTIPTGATGATGAVGPVGPIGPEGPTGADALWNFRGDFGLTGGYISISGTLTSPVSQGATPIVFDDLLYDGIRNGKPSYRSGNQVCYWQITSEPDAWVIYYVEDEPSFGAWYTITEPVASPELVTSWNPATTETGTVTVTRVAGGVYGVGDVVTYNGETWYCNTAYTFDIESPQYPVTGSSYWQLIAAKGVNDGIDLPLAGGTMDTDAAIVLSTSANSATLSGDGVSFDNGASIRKGTTAAGGNKGVALKCSIDYELKWEAGRLYTMEQDGIQIRRVDHCGTTVPTTSDDSTKGFVAGSIWTLDDGSSYKCTSAAANNATWVDHFTFTIGDGLVFSPTTDTLSCNTNIARRAGNQTFTGVNTFSGQVELTGQALTNGTSAVTRDLGDTRYGAVYVGIKTENVESTNNTPIKLISVTLPIGMYQIDCCIAATAAANNGGFIFGLRADNAIRTTLFELYGADAAVTQNNMVPSDNLTISQRPITASTLALTGKRQLMGLLEVVTNNTEVSIEFSQNTTTPAVPSITRKRSYIIARKIA